MTSGKGFTPSVNYHFLLQNYDDFADRAKHIYTLHEHVLYGISALHDNACDLCYTTYCIIITIVYTEYYSGLD